MTQKRRKILEVTVSGNLDEGTTSVVTEHRSKAVKRESWIGQIKELASQQMRQSSVKYFTSCVKGPPEG